MYAQIKEQIKQPYYVQNYPNEGQRFVAWYLINVHGRDQNQAKDDITDGPNDQQIDAIYVNEESSMVYVIQGKFINEASVDGKPLQEVLSAWLKLRDLVRLQENGNEKLKRKLEEIARAIEDEYEVTFELLTTGTLTKSARADLLTFEQQLTALSDKEESDSVIKLVDQEEIKRRYELALDRDNPSLNHSIQLEEGTFVRLAVANTTVVLAAIPLEDCLLFPGINDGTLFQKNVRQSLGLSNAVNKGIKSTIIGERHKDFFFFHNGITAIAKSIALKDGLLTLKGLNVVNGCQSLTTIMGCSETVKQRTDTSMLFRFYEIPQADRADRISTYTNSQSAVKARDLRSNDKRVVKMKSEYQTRYGDGTFLTKRGEVAPGSCDKKDVVDLANLGKYLISWHSKRPNIAYSETKIFDKYFEQLFKRGQTYSPEDVHALNTWMHYIDKAWDKMENPLGFDPALLVMRSYAPYHHLFAVSTLFAIISKQPNRVPFPRETINRATNGGLIDKVIAISGKALNRALLNASTEAQAEGKLFSPQNWVKAKGCLAPIASAISNRLDAMTDQDGGDVLYNRLYESLSIAPELFEERWAAD